MGAIAYKGKIYGGGGNVEDLKDVEVTNIADGDILEYDAETEKWKNSNALSNKVDKVAGKGLSTNDYTDSDKDLVATIPDKADSDDISGAKNITGNPIIIEDSANAYAEEMIANIEPIQDLHGYDKPWVGGAGKNLLPMTVDGIKAANTEGTWNGNAYTLNSVTFTIQTDSDGNVTGINANGTAASDTELILPTANNPLVNTIISGCPSNGSNTTYFLAMQQYNGSGQWGARAYDYGSGQTYGGISYEYLVSWITIKSGYNASGLIFKPMIRLATETDASFAPYTNMSSITGIDKLDIDGCGKNLFDKTAITDDAYLDTAEGVEMTGHAGYCITDYIPVAQNESVYIPASGTIRRWFYDSNKRAKSFLNNSSAQIFTPTENGFIRVSIDKQNYSIDSFQIEIGNQATAYEPYTPNNHTLPLGRTVYGGKLNVQTGELVVDRASVDLGSLNWSRESTAKSGIYRFHSSNLSPSSKNDGNSVWCISDSFESDTVNHVYAVVKDNTIGCSDIAVYATSSVYNSYSGNDFKTAMSGKYMVYELATPITYHLTHEQIKLLKGYNYITTNADTLDVTYQPDNVLGEILGEAEGYTDRVAKKLSDELDEVFNLPTGTAYSVNLKTYTLQNTFECPKDGIVNISIDSGETGMLGFGIYSPSGAVYKDVYGSADHVVNDYAIVKKGMGLYHRGNANGTLKYLYNPM